MFLRPLPTSILALFLGLTAYAASAIELTLNQQQIAVLNSELLLDHTVPDPGINGLPSVRLEMFFPWLTDVTYLTMKSGTDLQRWESDRLKTEDWNRIKLVWNQDRWEVRLDQNVFENPHRISVRGAIFDVSTLRIWSSIHDEEYIGNLKSALVFRDIKTEWRKIQQLPYLLHNIPQESLPHLILLDDIGLINLVPELTSYNRITDVSSQWLTVKPEDFPNGTYPYPLALNLRDAITSLHWLLAESPDLFSQENQIPDIISDILGTIVTYSDNVIDTTTPMESLSSNEVMAAIYFPWSDEILENNHPYTSIPAPGNSVKILRSNYAAIPDGLLPHDVPIASRVLDDAIRFSRLIASGESAPIPIHSRLLRYLKSYSRIGRLVSSGEMGVSEGIKILSAYTGGKQ